MSNNWNDVENLMKQKIASENSPSMDASQMWANVEQHLPKKRKRAFWLIIPLILLLLTGVLAYLSTINTASTPPFKTAPTTSTEVVNAIEKGTNNVEILAHEENVIPVEASKKTQPKSAADPSFIQTPSSRILPTTTLFAHDLENPNKSENPKAVIKNLQYPIDQNNSGDQGVKTEQTFRYLSLLSSVLPVSGARLLPNSLLYMGRNKLANSAPGLLLYSGIGMNLPRIKGTDEISYQPIIGKEFFLGLYKTKKTYHYDIRFGINEINTAFDFKNEKTQSYTYTDVPLQVYIDAQGNVIETVNGDTTVNQTISRNIAHNNLVSLLSLQAKAGKSFYKSQWTFDADLALKGMYTLQQSGRYLLETSDFSSIQDSKKYGLKKWTFAPGASVSANYRWQKSWTVGMDVNYLYLSKNNWNTPLHHSAHLWGTSVYVRYRIK